MRSASEPGVFVADIEMQALLSRFCASEEWSGDLSSGLIQIGSTAAELHRLDNRACGLLDLVRGYDDADRNSVVELFEQAATMSSSFCFSTTIVIATGGRQPVFCIGQSSGLEKRYSGVLNGLFFFPHFQTDTRPLPELSRQ